MSKETNGASNPAASLRAGAARAIAEILRARRPDLSWQVGWGSEEPQCVLCGEPVEPWPGGGGYGHNPDPLATEGRACDTCNETQVIPARIRELEGR